MALVVPTAYRPGHESARRSDPELADRYCEHTMLGDPLAEAAVEAMAGMPQERIHQLITAGMDEDAAGFRDAPAELRRLLEASAEVPDWFDSRAVVPGCRAFTPIRTCMSRRWWARASFADSPPSSASRSSRQAG
jgi:hypothetical protein